MSQLSSHVKAVAGLPRLLVDVRHEATHNELPSLAVLRLAAERALEWLATAYWACQADFLKSSRARLAALIKELLAERTAAVSKGFTSPHKGGVAAEEVEIPSDDGSLYPGQTRQAPGQEPAAMSASTELKRLGKALLPSEVAACILEGGALQEACSSAVPRQQQLGLDDTMSRLCLWFPDLQAAILLNAVQHLISPAAGRASGGQHVLELDERCMLWLRLLLQPLQGDSKGDGKSGKQRPASSWRSAADPAQLRTLLASTYAAPKEPSTDPREADAEIGPRGCLAEVQGLLTAALAAARPAGSAKPGMAEEAAASAPVLPEEGSKVGLLQLQEAAELDMQRQLASLQAARQQMSVASEDDEPDQKRWKLAEGWRPCAVGNLPSVHSRHGEPSCLEGSSLTLGERSS